MLRRIRVRAAAVSRLCAVLCLLAACGSASGSPATPTPPRVATDVAVATATPAPAPATPSRSAMATNPTATATSAPPTAAAPPAREAATVLRVIDGDTIAVRFADGHTDTVRYIGIDTPETKDPRTTVECFGEAAAAKNAALVDGRAVDLEKDVSERDRYNRLLRYVWVVGDDGATRHVNEELVRWGFAAASSYPPDVRHQETFRSLQQAAQQQRLGLWGACRSAHDSLPTATVAGPIAVPPTPTPRTAAPPPTATTAPARRTAPAGGFDPTRYIGQGNRYNCPDFASQAQAQAVLRADPGDPNGLDADKDGSACEGNPAPRDLAPVPRR